ncbi:MAG: membrane dipeptidase [Firmicutes bacterium]|nr:membrane dipeptidase [Bacillota bacterium]MCL1944939.1 membrane dipeptidase [Bacillota bacterium]MCL1954269.1 membrane dipeptidase [Bacillota bacterium]
MTKLNIFDFHNDIVTSEELILNQKLDWIIEQSKCNGIILALWTSKKSLTLENIKSILQPYIDLNLPNVYFSIEDINIHDYRLVDLKYVNNDIYGTYEKNKYLFFCELATMPFLFYGIVWNNSNRYASSCMSGNIEDCDGLTHDGKIFLHTLLQHNKVVDTAHASRNSFYDILDCVQGKNIVCSHACFEPVYKHPRNLDYYQCKSLVECDGLVGLTLVKNFLCEHDTKDTWIQRVVRHIDWFVQNFGVDNLCIGTDFFGTSPLPTLSSYDEIAILRDFLVNLGYNNGDIDKLMFSNLQNYISRIFYG